jgi:rhomboid family GlyGly-CTERM serine protease
VELFALTRAALEGELWRLWTGHLVHFDFGHLAFNVLAAVPPFLLIGRRARRALLAQLFLIAPLLSGVLLFVGGFEELRGASGLIVAAWCSAGIILLRERRHVEGLLLLAAIATKLVLDRYQMLPLGSNAFAVSTAAHAAGAMLAFVLAPLIGPRATVRDDDSLRLAPADGGLPISADRR